MIRLEETHPAEPAACGASAYIHTHHTHMYAQAGIVAPLLATVLEQLSNGGGAKAVTVESVGEEVEELGRQYPIRIPAYFGLIIR